MIHIAEAWKRCDELTLSLAERFPAATFTCIRDIYGRCSFAIESLPLDDIERIKSEVSARADVGPYLGMMGVRVSRKQFLVPIPSGPSFVVDDCF